MSTHGSRSNVLAAAVMLACGAVWTAEASPPTTPVTPVTTARAIEPMRPTSRPKVAPDPLILAVGALQREANDAIRFNRPFPRTEPNYFADRAEPAVDAGKLLEALTRRINSNPRIDAYVKWQLLSAISTFDGELAASATRAYVLGAPEPLAAPSIDAANRARWDARLGPVNDAEGAAKLNDVYAAAREPIDLANGTIVAYRDALRARIVPPDDAGRGRLLAATLEDLGQRAAAGVETSKDLTKFAADVEAWAATASPKDVAAMARVVDEHLARKSRGEVYETVTLDARGRARWSSDEARLDEKKLIAIKTQLLAAQRGAR